ncbi:hydrolase [Streptomyces sp. NPDC006251]|uniref:hydrolase n=1 Tax=Streptomyces sp. NPDC006251 TaxID=3155718 RepID=UPI0033BE811A
MDPVLHRLPAAFWTVPYVGSRFPGSSEVTDRPGLEEGANCQLFAYEVLRHFGLAPPALRSSELWADTQATAHVSAAQPLDLLLFNATDDAYGAHVGVWVNEGRVLHLCAEVGRPAVWEMTEFATRQRYRVLIGIKRVVDTKSGTPSAEPDRFRGGSADGPGLR